MKEGKDLWKKYCTFFEKDFSEQLEYNERKMEEYFEKWKSTKTAKQLCPEGVTKFEDIPITTYEDYPILREFGKKMEHLSKTVPRIEGESLWDYWIRIGKQAASMLDGWIVEEFALCSKTSGTSGESKWFVHGASMLRNATKYSIAIPILACSDHWGDTKIKKDDKIINLLAPAPYGSATTGQAISNFFNPAIPNQIIENVTDMRRKMNMIINLIKSGEKIAFPAIVPPLLKQISLYFTAPSEFFKDKYESMSPGMGKFILYLKYLQAKRKKPKYKKLSEVFSVKGLAMGSADYRIYLDWIKNDFDIKPLNIFATSELLLGMLGTVNHKTEFIPLLESHYFEFMTKDGEIKKIDELEKEKVYTLIVSPFGSMLVRYNVGDMFRVVDFEQNGLPVLSFEGRAVSILDIRSYFCLSEALASKALLKAGIGATDAWAIAKLTEPTEHLLLLMEKEWDYSEEEASRAVFNALNEISEDFRNLIMDFKIERPNKVIEVEYLKRGTFTRYMMKRAKEGLPYGQIKVPKLITPEKSEIINLLRRV